MAKAEFDARLDLLPKSPGVYLMKDKKGEIIYVGKANNLPQRLRAYFAPNPQGSAKVQAMIKRIADFETITTENELEALILENSLIKSHRPKYNILLRDDKEYPYIRITLQENYPRVLKAFRQGPDRNEGARYFGPYLAWDLKEALQAIYRIFPLKTCKRVFPRDIGKERPCLNYYIGRCIAPCRGDVTESEYRAIVDQVIAFLEGRYEELLARLEKEMLEHAERLEFEEAAEIRDRQRALAKLMERQKIDFIRAEDLDVLGLAENDSDHCLLLMRLRRGRIVQAGAQFFDSGGESQAELLEAYITQHYHPSQDLPRLILIPEDLPKERVEILEAYLQGIAGHKIELRRPQRGDKLALLEMASRNAAESLRRHTLLGGSSRGREASLELLAERLGLSEAPQQIEAFDIANYGSSDRTASMVVFLRGQPERSRYRHFTVQSFAGVDDYQAMAEVITRRLKRSGDSNFGRLPDLILVDGGKGHVNLIAQVLAAAGLDIPLAGIVKDERHRTRGLVRTDGEIFELSTESEGEQPEERSERLGLLRLLTAIQNEAHRFANRLLSKQHKKRSFKYSLDEIEGVGPGRRKALLKEFKSLKAISQASLAELEATPGLPRKVAAAVYRHFHQEEAQDGSVRDR
ncbi:MAG: excinuclease ABC subunit UvrC [Eubacteriales bacterium]|nr:excinuclease ABC subunit UvrC [Eubacteriales bacterium]